MPALRAHVVTRPDHVHTHLDQALCGCQMVAERDFENGFGERRIFSEIHQHLFQPAQCPGSLKYRGTVTPTIKYSFLWVAIRFSDS